MSAYNFFSNNLVYIDGENCEITKSLKNTRPDETKVFTSPNHTVGTPNLFVFLDGILKVSGVDYTDINSNEIEFKNNITQGQDVIIVLIRARQGESGSNRPSLEWEDFL